MLIMHQLTAVPALLSVLRLSWSRRSVCAHTLRRLATQGCALKVVVQTANLRLNGHFLWSGCGVCLVDWAKPLSPSLAHSESELVWGWSPARTFILVAKYEGLHSIKTEGSAPPKPTAQSL